MGASTWSSSSTISSCSACSYDNSIRCTRYYRIRTRCSSTSTTTTITPLIKCPCTATTPSYNPICNRTLDCSRRSPCSRSRCCKTVIIGCIAWRSRRSSSNCSYSSSIRCTALRLTKNNMSIGTRSWIRIISWYEPYSISVKFGKCFRPADFRVLGSISICIHF
jgi:hypothetical protein